MPKRLRYILVEPAPQAPGEVGLGELTKARLTATYKVARKIEQEGATPILVLAAGRRPNLNSDGTMAKLMFHFVERDFGGFLAPSAMVNKDPDVSGLELEMEWVFQKLFPDANNVPRGMYVDFVIVDGATHMLDVEDSLRSANQLYGIGLMYERVRDDRELRLPPAHVLSLSGIRGRLHLLRRR